MMPAPQQLTSELDYWTVVLKDGSTVAVRAHSYNEEGDDLVFVALMAGTPNYEQELVRFAKCATQDVEGGWTKPR